LKTYFLIYGSEDGTQILEYEDEEKLKAALLDHGFTEFRATFGKDYRERDPNYWGEDNCLIIKGEIIVPKPKKVVQDWEL